MHVVQALGKEWWKDSVLFLALFCAPRTANSLTRLELRNVCVGQTERWLDAEFEAALQLMSEDPHMNHEDEKGREICNSW